MKKLCIVKIGGNVVDDPMSLKKFINSFSKINTPKILVHGGGKLATKLSSELGIETKMVDGRRITDSETLKIATMVYAGWINKSIVATLNSKKVPSAGLCGADLLLIPAKKRTKGKVDYGFVGDVSEKEIDTKTIGLFLNNKITLVIAPITSTRKGQLLNTNADTIASTLACALSKKYDTTLVYCFEKNGVLNNEKVISKINESAYQDLKTKGIVKDGMIPKLDNAFDAIHKGVKKVVIGHANQINKLILSHAGTSITK